MDSNAAGTEKLSILSEALKDYDIDLRAVALNQVIKGWPLRGEPQSKTSHSEADSDKIRHFADLSHWMLPDCSFVDKTSELSVIAWGVRASYLMNQLLVDSSREQAAPLTSEAEAGLRRGISAMKPSLPKEIISGLPLFGEEVLADVHSGDLFTTFRDIVETRACFDLVQMGLSSDLKKLTSNHTLSPNSGINALYDSVQSLRGEQWPDGIISRYLQPLLAFRSDFQENILEPIKDELIRSIINPLFLTLSRTIKDSRLKFDSADIKDVLDHSITQFASMLSGQSIQQTGKSSAGAEPVSVASAVEHAGIDLALYEFFHQSLRHEIDNEFIDEVNQKWEHISDLLDQNLKYFPFNTRRAAEQSIFESFRVQLGIYLANVQLLQEGLKFNSEIEREIRRAIAPLQNPTAPIEQKANTRTELISLIDQKKPCPDAIIRKAASTLTELFPLIAPESDEKTIELKNTLQALCRVELKETIDSWCEPHEERINTRLGLKCVQHDSQTGFI